MSIAAAIVRLEGEGRLFRYVPPRTRRPARRRLYLVRNAHRDFTEPSSATNILVGKGFIEAALTRWTLGDPVFAANNGKKGGFLKELEPPPPDIWEIRVTAPTPQARLLGAFAAQDTLVLLGFYTRPALGDKGSAAWTAAMQSCASRWSAEFDQPAFHGMQISDYVSENCDSFPLKR